MQQVAIVTAPPSPPTPILNLVEEMNEVGACDEH